MFGSQLIFGNAFPEPFGTRDIFQTAFRGQTFAAAAS